MRPGRRPSGVASLPAVALALGLLGLLAGCCSATPPPAGPPAARTSSASGPDATALVARVIDDWHAAAARADEAAYFGHFHPSGVFLGTDATERWDVASFRAYAHPHFQKGRAWSFRSVRRSIQLAPDGRTAWFEEDLATPNLGPARGSGVLLRVDAAGGARWQIAQYNLSVPIPNNRFDDVKRLIGTPAAPKQPPPPTPTPAAP